MLPATTPRAASELELMAADALLPDDIRPAGACRALAQAGTVLVTGATGFVGAHLLHTLLRDTALQVVCLVRPDDEGNSGLERIRRSLARHARLDPHWEQRIEIVSGDVARPGLGLSEEQQALLAERVDAFFHGAAAVNWVLPYARLRAANVL